MGEQKKKRFHMPHAYTLIFLLIVLVAVLTWIIPSGEFQRTMVETSTGEREVVVAGTYHELIMEFQKSQKMEQT